jgi:uncharacterized protein with HEPN domain
MAESTQHLSEDLKANYPEVEWRALGGFRNVLVHDYLGIDIEKVYMDVQQNLPALKVAIQGMLDTL